MKEVYVVGEDPVTKEIVSRIIRDYAPNLYIKGYLPARGGEIKKKMEATLDMKAQHGIFIGPRAPFGYPVVLLSDMDADDCAPMAKDNLTKGMSSQNSGFIINIAVDEAEAWLFADIKGFARYLGVAEEHMPHPSEQKFGGPKKRMEMEIPLKASYFLTHKVIVESNKKDLGEQIHAPGKACKGPEYNPALLPFIKNDWNIEEARKNSYSLDGMIKRVSAL